MPTAPVTSSRGAARRAEILRGLVEIFLAEGFLDFSLEDLAGRLKCSKSTLYGVAPSKEQLVTAVVRTFFRDATAQVDRRIDGIADPVERIGTYLRAIAEALEPASPRFYADVIAFAPARAIYARNTSIAAARVEELLAQASGDGASDRTAFLGAVTRSVMESIQRGDIESTTGLTDASAYAMLAELVVAGVRRHGA